MDTYGMMKELGELVRIQRESAGFATQRAFADHLKRSQSWLSRIESGRIKELPAPEDMQLISSALGLDLVTMLAAAGYSVTPENGIENPAMQALRPIVESRKWSASEVQQLASMVRGMVDLLEAR